MKESSEERAPGDFVTGEWRVRPDACVIERNGSETKLSPRSMDVLVYLAEHAGQAVTHDRLLAEFWRGAISSPNAVHKSVAELRRALEDDPRSAVYIETVPKRGYRLVAPVRRCAAVAPGGLDHAFANGHVEVQAQTTVASHVDVLSAGSRRRYTAWAITAALALAVMIFEAFGITTPPHDKLADNVNSSATAQSKAIAVLGFRNVGSFSDDSVLAEGISDAIRSEVRMRGVRVAERDVSVVHASAYDDPRSIGRALNVGYVVDGSLERRADHLHVRASLIDVVDGQVLFTYDKEQPLSDVSTVQAKVAATLLNAVHVYLDDSELKAMTGSGTQDVDAYAAVAEGSAERQLSRDIPGQQRAAAAFRRAVKLDPGYVHAYGLLAEVLEQQGYLSPSKEFRQSLLDEVTAIEAEILRHNPSPVDIQHLHTLKGALAGESRPEREARLRSEITASKTKHCLCYAEYGTLLASSRLFVEADQYLTLAEREDWAFMSITRSWITRLREGPRRAIPLQRNALRELPNDVSMLSAMISMLGQVGEFDEADEYLAHLTSIDTDGLWAYGAKLQLDVLRGRLTLGSDALRAAFADPRAVPLSRSIVEFMLGDVDGGIADWRSFDPATLNLAGDIAPSVETEFPQSVLEDPRYQKMLDDLGMGRKWSAFMREKVKELAPITGIDAEPHSNVAAR